MVNVLVVSDEVVESLWSARPRQRPGVLLGAGDLPRDYLEHLATTMDVPFAFVPGNHDPDWSGIRLSRAGLPMRAGLPAEQVAPAGGVNVDGRVADVGGLRVAGLGGSIRYRPGPNQYTQAEQTRRARTLVRRARRLRRRDGRGVDVLLTHSPPLGCGDDEDGPHQGFEALHRVVAALEPTYLLHGHIHPFGRTMPDRRIGTTTVVNCVPRRSLEIEPRPG